MATLHKVPKNAGSEQQVPGVSDVQKLATLGDEDVVPLASAYRANETIGDKYRLVRMLGEGGMGAVWLARNVALEADVAIKLLRDGERSQRQEERLLKEARAVARLGHPAIVRVFDFGITHLGDPYIVMELLDGEDLSQALARRGRLNAIKAVRTLLPVLHALGTAHQKGIVHRDLKPENIFLTNNDSGHMQPKVVDFGIVKTGQPEIDRLTRLGTVLGTPAYLCPEQARGQDVDHRADIWSASVVLYEMITGRLPFEGPNYNALMRSIIEDNPPPTTSFSAGDEALWNIMSKGLAKDPKARWSAMEPYGCALADWLILHGESDDIAGASLRGAWHQSSGTSPRNVLYSGRPETPLSEAAALISRPTQTTVGRLVAPAAAPRSRLVAVAGALGLAVVLAFLWFAFGRSGESQEQTRKPSEAASAPSVQGSPGSSGTPLDARPLRGGPEPESIAVDQLPMETPHKPPIGTVKAPNNGPPPKANSGTVGLPSSPRRPSSSGDDLKTTL